VDRRLRFDENVVRWMDQQELGPDLSSSMNSYKEAYQYVHDRVNEKTG
jgi:hypothetical protein